VLPLGGLHVKHAVQRGIWVPIQHLLWDQGKPWSSWLVAEPSGCQLTSSQQSGISYASPETRHYLCFFFPFFVCFSLKAFTSCSYNNFIRCWSRSYFTTVSQSVCLGIEYPCGTCDQILLPVEMLLSEICGLVSMVRTLWREDGSAICGVITQWSESLRTETILHCLIWDSPNLVGQVPVFIFPEVEVEVTLRLTVSQSVNMSGFCIIYINSVRTSQETHWVFATKA
jgi:hypothetical protein